MIEAFFVLYLHDGMHFNQHNASRFGPKRQRINIMQWFTSAVIHRTKWCKGANAFNYQFRRRHNALLDVVCKNSQFPATWWEQAICWLKDLHVLLHEAFLFPPRSIFTLLTRYDKRFPYQFASN
jgi:hypothetical protein